MEHLDLIKRVDEQFRYSVAIPVLPKELLSDVLSAYEEHGYSQVGGSVGSYSDCISSLVKNYDKAAGHLNRGALLGPHVWHEQIEQNPGVMLWMPPSAQ